MSTTAVTFSDSEISMRFGALYTSAEFNSKFAGTVSRGIYSGYRLTPSATPRVLVVAGDENTGDHVALAETSTGYSLAIKKTGNFNISLASASFNSKTVVIAIKPSYAINTTTSATIEIYELAPSDTFTAAPERDELIVLGTVVCPATSVVIPAANISPEYRDYAWQNEAPAKLQWNQIIRNGGFERSVLDLNSKYASNSWEISTILSGCSTVISDSVPRTNNASLQLNSTVPGAKSGNMIRQQINSPAFLGQEFRLRFYLKVVAAASTGSLTARLAFRDNIGETTYYAEASGSTLVTSVDADYRLVEFSFRSSTTSPSTMIASLDFDIAATFAVAAPVLYIDDVQLFAENKTTYEKIAESERSESTVIAMPLILAETALLDYQADKALVYYDPLSPSEGGGSVVVDRVDQAAVNNPPMINQKGRLTLGENLLNTEARALRPRVTAKYSVTGGIDYTLMWESPASSGTVQTPRLYVSSTGIFMFTYNARWNGTAFARDVVSASTAFMLTGDGLTVLSNTAGGATFSTFTETISNLFSSGSDSNFMTNTLDLGVDFTQLLAFSTPRLKFKSLPIGTEDRTLLIEFQAGDGSNGFSRLYLTSTGNIEFVKNASWNGSAWARDINANATKMLFDGTQLKLFIQLAASTGSPWSDSWGAVHGYTLDLATGTITSIDGIYKTTGTLTISNPASTVALTNELRALNMCKAWGNVSSTGGVGTIVVNDGANIATATLNSGNIRITMASAMANTNYSVTANIKNNVYYINPNIVSTTVFDLQVVNASGSQVTLATNNETVMFQVCGRQS